MDCSASISARLLNVLSVFAVFSLLHFESDLPGGRYCHEPVLQPNQVFPEAPVRRHYHASVILFCLWNLSSYLVRVHVPVLLPANSELVQPVSCNITNLLLDVLKLAYVFWQALRLSKLSWLHFFRLDLVHDTCEVRLASCLCF
jgi:hypothetical protein